MEPSGRNRRQPSAKAGPKNPLNYLRTVAKSCHRLLSIQHGKEGVDGSSPSEGLQTARMSALSFHRTRLVRSSGHPRHFDRARQLHERGGAELAHYPADLAHVGCAVGACAKVGVKPCGLEVRQLDVEFRRCRFARPQAVCGRYVAQHRFATLETLGRPSIAPPICGRQSAGTKRTPSSSANTMSSRVIMCSPKRALERARGSCGSSRRGPPG
jgi:hypothetical protein